MTVECAGEYPERKGTHGEGDEFRHSKEHGKGIILSATRTQCIQMCEVYFRCACVHLYYIFVIAATAMRGITETGSEKKDTGLHFIAVVAVGCWCDFNSALVTVCFEHSLKRTLYTRALNCFRRQRFTSVTVRRVSGMPETGCGECDGNSSDERQGACCGGTLKVRLNIYPD